MIPVNSITIPSWVVALCSEWYDGIGCKLYAVASTGGLTIGNRRPRGADTPQKWYLSIWRDFSVDIGRAAHAAQSMAHEDMEALILAEKWVDLRCDDLEVSYGLEDW